MKSTVLSILIVFICIATSIAHDGKKHKKDSTKVPVDTTLNTGAAQTTLEGDSAHHDGGMDESKVTADLDDFPTLHPLIVHFAIVLIIVAAGLQLVNLWLMKPELAWIIAVILLAGVLTAWLAANKFHPHTDGISAHAQRVLDQHDLWADWTIYSGFVAVLLQAVNLFVFKNMRWAAAIIALVLVVSAYSVSRAGHYGSQLVHLEGIGPQGKFLEIEHEH